MNHLPLSQYHIGDKVSIFRNGQWKKGKVSLSQYSHRGYRVMVSLGDGDISIFRWSEIRKEN